jgi:hypothetical protein
VRFCVDLLLAHVISEPFSRVLLSHGGDLHSVIVHIAIRPPCIASVSFRMTMLIASATTGLHAIVEHHPYELGSWRWGY